jgi:hypothetical protein
MGRHAGELEIEARLVAQLREEFQRQQAITEKDFLRYINDHIAGTLARSWVHAFLRRHLDELQLCKWMSQEDHRPKAPRAFQRNTLKTYLRLHSRIGVQFGSGGIDDREDRRQQTVIARAEVPEHGVFRPISTGVRHLMLFVCVSAAIDSLTPVVMASNPMSNDIWSHRLREDEDVLVPVRRSALIDEASFSEYMPRAFLPYVEAVRSKAQFACEQAVLLMDSVRPHEASDVLALLERQSVAVIVFPVHATNSSRHCTFLYFLR